MFRWLTILMLLASSAHARMPITVLAGPGPTGGGAGGGGTACLSPTNFAASAAHLYFWQDNSWTAAGDPDDEGGGTDQALEVSANLTDSGDLSSSDLPAGTPTGSTYYALDLNGTDETAKTDLNEPGFMVAANYGDSTLAFWVKEPTLGGSADFWTNHGTTDDDGWVYIASDGHISFGTPYNASGLESAAGDITASAWHHIAVVDDGDGAGNSTKRIYVDGALVAGPTSDLSLIDSGGVSPMGFNASDPALVHAAGIWHSALSAAEVKTMACCGINGDVGDLSARETLTGLDCSGE